MRALIAPATGRISPERLLAYADRHRIHVRLVAGAMIVTIAYLDWLVPSVSLGFLYVIPILLIASQVKGWYLVAIAGLCALLREVFGPKPWEAGGMRLVVVWLAFVVVGFAVAELNRKRELVTRNLELVEEQIRLRETAEQEIRVLIETSPLAVLVLDHGGRVVQSNRTAQQILGGGSRLDGMDVRPNFPLLEKVLETQPKELRTTLECKAQRMDGEVFLAQMWLSSCVTAAGPGLAAVIWDASENLRDREAAGLDSMLDTSRVLIGAVSHEIRNLAAAAVAAHKQIVGVPGVEDSEGSKVLGSILEGMVRLSSTGLTLSSNRSAAVSDLGTLLDEARIVIEPGIREADGRPIWKIPPRLPLVQGDHLELLQVFLNLARNSQRAIRRAAKKEFAVEAAVEGAMVVVRVTDTGGGVANPDALFQPFQSHEHSTGLGLYVARAIVRAHGGDLRYEGRGGSSCFVVELSPAENNARL